MVVPSEEDLLPLERQFVDGFMRFGVRRSQLKAALDASGYIGTAADEGKPIMPVLARWRDFDGRPHFKILTGHATAVTLLALHGIDEFTCLLNMTEEGLIRRFSSSSASFPSA